jgi:tripartite-type tricarboxylate transporter receptor subunit TctC
MRRTSTISEAIAAPAYLLAILALFGGSVSAQGWPDHPVKIIMPYAPGGAGDAIARPWAEALTKHFNQPFVVENRGGASGTIGVEAAVKSAPDGYTLLLTPNSAINVVTSLRKVAYDAATQLQPVARVGDVIGGFVVHPSLGVKTMAELVSYAKNNPGKLIFGTPGPGTSVHLRAEILKLKTGIDMLIVHYRGSGDALNDLLPGNVHMMNELVVFPHVKAGKLNLLAMSHTERHWDFPNVPTLDEAGIKDAIVPIWFALWVPIGTPREIIVKLNAAVVQLARTDDMKARMKSLSVLVPIQTPEEVGQYFHEDKARNLKVIKAANIKLD